ncbi:hypothetical protein BOTBODRAFT_120577 [Botryobasidium botryosum FD-172 SS1]|uniref:Dihydrodipicolinate synthase n=1 Tax=Botryobasidium botryosum (strain FD-172 SS1) TaxID=930990 RepID=A0A067LXI4_BOTB1|nr:hypothetical protein BOTBODRAFT_120577 [Botryobasidium botryosum FD-172 SS1]
MPTTTTTTNGANGFHHESTRPLSPGIFAPLPTFFLPGSEDLDIPTFQKHAVTLAKAGVGILIAGSMGEGHHLSQEERRQLISSARAALDGAELSHVPIVAGTGAPTTRETHELTRQAAKAGADYAIVIASGYFAGALANDRAALLDFFTEVADQSPIPVIIYNYPGAAGGIDLDSDLIEDIAKKSSNICGVKLTCGNVGKLTRIAATTAVPSFEKQYPRKNKDAPFLVLGGFADFILPAAFARGHGAIVGLANVAPRTLHQLCELSFQAINNPSLLPAAQHLQDIVARADRTIALAGIPGTKYLLSILHPGYPTAPRRPLRTLDEASGKRLWAEPNVRALIEIESQLESEATA